MSSQPLPETPLQATRELLDVSVTELGQYRTCHRRWYLDTIENLEPKTADPIELEYGTAMHRALDAYHSGEGEEAAYQAVRDWHAREWKRQDYQPDDESWQKIREHAIMGLEILDHYFVFDRNSKVQLGRILAVEGRLLTDDLEVKIPDDYPAEARVIQHPSGRLMVPIVHPDTREVLRKDGRVCYLTARIDLLSERLTPKSGLWVTDHKNLSKAPSDKGLDFDDQITGYCYVVWRWIASIPRGVVYNTLLKNLPEEPRRVRETKKNPWGLSYAKDQMTTPELYREALREEGIMLSDGTIISEDHATCLGSLLSKGWDRFFLRNEVTRNEDQLLNFERRLFTEHEDMAIALADPTADLLYPNPSVYLCPRCPVNRICLAMEDGSDWEYIVENAYKVGPDRKALR